MNKHTMLATILVAGMLAGCQSTQQRLVESGATPLTKQEVVTLLAGKTVVWTKGGAYYGPDGSLDTLWEGTREAGTWQATEVGEVCWQVPSWGNTPCEAYFHDGEDVTWVYKNRSGRMDRIHDGNVVDTL